MTPVEIHLRVDFAGGWLDVPKFSKKGSYIVNCTISPKIALNNWHYEKGSGLGGSAAYSLLSGNDSVLSELKMGVGWQDPAVILETGLCVWRSGKKPILEMKANPDFLNGKMALLWTGRGHFTPGIKNFRRDYKKIELAGKVSAEGVLKKDIKTICKGVRISYETQIDEGMEKLPEFGELAKKYCGGGYGGYALYIFESDIKRKKFLKNKNTLAIEPHIREY
jgi:hypothetical protein